MFIFYKHTEKCKKKEKPDQESNLKLYPIKIKNSQKNKENLRELWKNENFRNDTVNLYVTKNATATAIDFLTPTPTPIIATAIAIEIFLRSSALA